MYIEFQCCRVKCWTPVVFLHNISHWNDLSNPHLCNREISGQRLYASSVCQRHSTGLILRLFPYDADERGDFGRRESHERPSVQILGRMSLWAERRSAQCSMGIRGKCLFTLSEFRYPIFCRHALLCPITCLFSSIITSRVPDKNREWLCILKSRRPRKGCL